MLTSMTNPTYLFLDESGNFDFSVNGSRHFILTSVRTRRPFPWFNSLDNYKYDCIENDQEKERFHCVDDDWPVRKKVFDMINNYLNDIQIDSLIIQKNKTHPSLWEAENFYPRMLIYLLKYVLKYERNEIVVIIDAIPVKKKRIAIEKGIKIALANVFPNGVKHRILHHDSRSHYGLQVADYCCWAINRKWKLEEDNTYNRIRAALKSEFDIFEKGNMTYY